MNKFLTSIPYWLNLNKKIILFFILWYITMISYASFFVKYTDYYIPVSNVCQINAPKEYNTNKVKLLSEYLVYGKYLLLRRKKELLYGKYSPNIGIVT